VKQLYAGSATCFDYTLSGNSGGAEVRLAFTQAPTTAGLISPYVPIPAFSGTKSGTICFKDVGCQTQTLCSASVTTGCCSPITGNGTPYDIQVSVAGGNNNGAFNICLTSLTPKGNGSSTYTQLCGAQGASGSTEAVDKYTAQNNIFQGGGSLCMTPGFASGNASFSVDSASLNNLGNSPSAYPSIVDGWHYNTKSTDSALPKLASSVGTIMSNAAFTGSASKYDASYDIWVLPTTTQATPANGLEVMIWLNSAGVQPSGTDSGQALNGYEIWTGTVSSWKYVAFRGSGKTSFSDNLMTYISKAITLSGMQAGSVYVAGIEFGFELWQGAGSGMKVTQFNATVN
jgi:hypothetical protein